MAKGIISIVIRWFLMMAIFLVGYRFGKRDVPVAELKHPVDTLIVRDTITIREAFFEEKITLQKVLVPVTDTLIVRERDTIFVEMQREQVVWRDTLSAVYASGVMPEVDSVKHFISERIVRETEVIEVKKRCKWGIGIQAGYGIGLSGDVRMTPYVGIGVSYNLLGW